MGLKQLSNGNFQMPDGSVVTLENWIDETIRIQTPHTISPRVGEKVIIRALYVIPPEHLREPPFPNTLDTIGTIELHNVVRAVPRFRASVVALMDSYWRFAYSVIDDPSARLVEIRKTAAALMADERTRHDFIQLLRDALLTPDPGRLLCDVHVESDYPVEIRRTAGPDATVQIQTLRRVKVEK